MYLHLHLHHLHDDAIASASSFAKKKGIVGDYNRVLLVRPMKTSCTGWSYKLKYIVIFNKIQSVHVQHVLA